MPALNRGTPVKEPVLWTRGVTPPVEYTGRPLQAPPLPTLSKWAKRKQHQADVRLRRALVDAWADPERAQKDLNAAGLVYNELLDAQGLANVFMAHAQRGSRMPTTLDGASRCARATYLSSLSTILSIYFLLSLTSRSVCFFLCAFAAERARVQHGPRGTPTRTSSTPRCSTRVRSTTALKRQVSVHKVAVDQFMRPIPAALRRGGYARSGSGSRRAARWEGRVLVAARLEPRNRAAAGNEMVVWYVRVRSFVALKHFD